MIVKRCGCAEHEGPREVPINNFFKHKSTLDGYTSTCKVCSKRQQQRARSANIDDYRKNGREYYQKTKANVLAKQKHTYNSRKTDVEFIIRQMLSNAKGRSRKYGLDFNITVDDIHIPDICPVLLIPIIRSSGTATDNSPTLDRIDSSKGYIKGNVHVISKRANTIKNCGTPDEHRLIYEYFSSRHI